jgi:hypothetical protein
MKRYLPYNPAMSAHIQPVEIDDPAILGAKVVALRNFKGDPLSWLWSHGQIDRSQHEAGTAYQTDVEIIGANLRAMDVSREYVDCRLPPEPATDRQRRSRDRLIQAGVHLGPDNSALVHDVLVDGCSMDEVARKRGLVGRSHTDRFGKQFRASLNILAVAYSFSTGLPH